MQIHFRKSFRCCQTPRCRPRHPRTTALGNVSFSVALGELRAGRNSFLGRPRRGLFFFFFFDVLHYRLDFYGSLHRKRQRTAGARRVPVRLFRLVTFTFQSSSSHKQINKAKQHRLKDNPCTFSLGCRMFCSQKPFRETRKESGFIALAHPARHTPFCTLFSELTP